MIKTWFRNIALGVLLLLCFQADAHAVKNPPTLFGKANEQLKNGYYQEALTAYKKLEQNKQWSGALFINMGITYQRIDSLGKAKYYYLKASRFDGTEERAKQAVEYLDNQFSHQSVKLPKLPWDVATEWLQRRVGAPALLAWGIILLNLGILVFISRWFFAQIPDITRNVAIGIMVLGILVIASGFYTRYIDDRYKQAVMVTEQSPVLEKPEKESTLISQSFEGYTFTVDEYKSQSKSGWSYVRMSNGLYGWIPNTKILIL